MGDDAESATDLPQARPEKKLDIVKAHVSRAYTWILHFLLGVTLTIILLRWQQKISPTCFDSKPASEKAQAWSRSSSLQALPTPHWYGKIVRFAPNSREVRSFPIHHSLIRTDVRAPRQTRSGMLSLVVSITAKISNIHDPDIDFEAGIIRLTEEEASRIPTEAVPLYGDEEGYAGFLEVFHQLHCLVRAARTQPSKIAADRESYIESNPKTLLRSRSEA